LDILLTVHLERRTIARDPKETLSLLARASRGGFLTTEDAAGALGLAPHQSSLMLGRLVRRGWLARVRRGLYLVLPLEAGREGAAIEDPWVLARALYAPCYIGGWTAAEHWGLTEQLFRSTFVVTAATIRHAVETFLGSELHLVRASPEHVALATVIWRGRERVAVSGRELTIADALAAPSWLGGVRHLVDVLCRYRESEGWNPKRLIERLDEIGSGAAFKRLGYLAETVLDADPDLVNAALARRTQGIVKLDPTVAERGRISTRWRLWVNVELNRAGADG
jgi:predicted transcriptional regulator of viral defense system